MDTSNIIIETKRLWLKSIGMEYKDDIFREFTSEITTYMFPRPAEKIEETIDFIKSSIKENKEGTNLQLVIVNKENKDFLGCAGLHNIETDTPELGVWIKKSAQDHAFGKEAMVSLKEWADKNLDFNYILYPVVEENYPSRKIPEYLGGKIFREYDEINMSGKKHHLLEYRICPKEDK